MEIDEQQSRSVESIGLKDPLRFALTLSMIELIKWSAALETRVKFNMCDPQVYMSFMQAFKEVVLTTVKYTSNIGLAKELDSELAKPWSFDDDDEYIERATRFNNLFQHYLNQLIDDGIFSPELIFDIKDRKESWND